MKPSFSLKWLFVGIAFAAVLCGWRADHRQLSKVLQLERHNVLVQNNIAARDRRNLLRLADLAATFGYFGFNYPDYLPGKDQGMVLLMRDGVVEERDAATLTACAIPNIVLEHVEVFPEAETIMAEKYDHSFDGKYHRYRLRSEGPAR